MMIDKIKERFPDLSERRQRQILKFLEEMNVQLKEDAVEDAVNLMLAIPIVVLSDKFGFDQEQLQQFASFVATWIRAVNDDPITMPELVEVAQNECGYEVILKG